ncbi:hypothetical protein OU798_07555 [Prolixibacteraceae bacterium Z1-6]|uniref:Uncharacterized protein n=1 Tax=Draconibacterium aestuarii TaxID=2998507 RepID=A0A9X3J594_9BACT|nr:hypothetical protein [Prolixibacteraceae bacterium Z1-6]
MKLFEPFKIKYMPKASVLIDEILDHLLHQQKNDSEPGFHNGYNQVILKNQRSDIVQKAMLLKSKIEVLEKD